MSEKRQRGVYRVATSPECRITVTLKSEDGEGFVGTVVDVTAKGIGVSFPPDLPGIRIGSVQEVELASNALRQPFSCEVRVCARTEERDGRRYGFQFTSPGEVDEGVGRRLRHLFNRRGSLRIAASQGLTIRLLEPEKKGAKPIATNPLDISSVGTGLIVDLEDEVRLSGEWEVGVDVDLPDGHGRLSFLGRIVRRELRAAGVFYGVAFLDDDSKEFHEDQETLVDFILERQREELQRRAG